MNGGTNLGGPVRLTPAELRVLGRLLAGETNKEIAQHLCCSPRTVEFHLARIFRKTGIETRARLISAVAGGRVKPEGAAAATTNA